jgi:hypothetical protein
MSLVIADLLAEMAALPGAATDPHFRIVQAQLAGPARIWCEAELSAVLAHRWTVVPLPNEADVRVDAARIGEATGAPPASVVRVITTGGTLGGGRIDAVEAARSIVLRHGGDAVVIDLAAARAAIHHAEIVRTIDLASVAPGALDVRDQVDERARMLLGVFGIRVIAAAQHEGRDPVQALLAASGIEELHEAINAAARASTQRSQRVVAEARAWLARRSDPASIRLCARLDSGRQLDA